MMLKQFEILMARGYFPKELPPVFTTLQFGSHATDILRDWEAAGLFTRKDGLKMPRGGGRKRSSYVYSGLPTPEPEIISTPKKGYERRNLHITHPIPQSLLAFELASGWPTISKWLCRGRYSIDQVSLSDEHSRGVRPLNFEAHRAKKAYIEAQSDWVVRTDITRFYPSVYTHSLAWAAYGKEAVKSSLKMYEGSLADRLDLLARACNRNQTVGIPVGPETSRILADIISSRIDDDFATLQPNFRSGQVDRLQDDWFIGTSSLSEAESALSALTQCYRSYGLDINGSKTAVERTVSPLSETWKGELAGFLSHSPVLSRSRLREFLHLSLRLQLDYPKDPIISYCLSVIEARRSRVDDVEALESFLIRSAAIAPGALHRICSVLINLHHDTKRVSIDRIRSRFTQLAERHLDNGQIYEVIWLLFTLRGLGAPLNSRPFCNKIESTQSSALILLLLDMCNRKLVWNPLPKTKWEDDIHPDRILADWSWLYAFEATSKGWLRDRRNILSEPFFTAMASRGVSFYDPARNVTRTEKSLASRKEQRRRDTRESLVLLSHLRGFEFGEYD